MQRPLDPKSLRPQAQRTPLVSFHCIMRRTSKWPAVFICVLLVTNCVGSGWLEDARLEVQAEAAVSLARRYQCPGAVVSMPCPPRGHRIHHLHIGKTGGRSVITELPRTLGIPLCDWPEWPDWRNGSNLWSNASGFNKVAAIRGVADEACITSYESTWGTVGAFKEPPFVVTFLREPMSWAASAIMHFYKGGLTKKPSLNDGPDRVIDLQRAEGCFSPPKADHLLPNQKVTSCLKATRTCASCNKKQQPTYPLPNFVIGQLDPGVPDGQDTLGNHVRPAFAAARLESTVFGLVEFVPTSYCLMQFQYGLANTSAWRKKCSCSNRRGGDGHAHVGSNHLYNSLTVRLDNIMTLAQGMMAYQLVYSHALQVFLDRVDHVKKKTGIKLIC